jgi:pyridoxine 4-dehydrogenase
MVQLHWPPSLGWQETEYLKAFNRIVKDKKAKQIGVSNYGPKTLRKVVNIVEKDGGKICSNQVQFSSLSIEPLSHLI